MDCGASWLPVPLEDDICLSFFFFLFFSLVIVCAPLWRYYLVKKLLVNIRRVEVFFEEGHSILFGKLSTFDVWRSENLQSNPHPT